MLESRQLSVQILRDIDQKAPNFFPERKKSETLFYEIINFISTFSWIPASAGMIITSTQPAA